MSSKTVSVEEYLAGVPPERIEIVKAIRNVILQNLPEGIEEGIQYDMIGYYVPHSIHPAGYHCDPKQPLPFVGLANQKNYVALYLMCVYTDENEQLWFRSEWQKTGKKLDMGKSCVRIKKLEDVPLNVVGQLIARKTVQEIVQSYAKVLADRPKRSS